MRAASISPAVGTSAAASRASHRLARFIAHGHPLPAIQKAVAELQPDVVVLGKHSGPRWQEHVGDIVAAGLAFGSGPCFELYHSMSNDPLQDDVSFCSSVR